MATTQDPAEQPAPASAAAISLGKVRGSGDHDVRHGTLGPIRVRAHACSFHGRISHVCLQYSGSQAELITAGAATESMFRTKNGRHCGGTAGQGEYSIHKVGQHHRVLWVLSREAAIEMPAVRTLFPEGFAGCVQVPISARPAPRLISSNPFVIRSQPAGRLAVVR